MSVPEILGYYEIRDSARGYDEIMFAEEMDISDSNVDRVNTKIVSEFGLADDEALDWRDPNTLWIWYDRDKGGK